MCNLPIRFPAANVIGLGSVVTVESLQKRSSTKETPMNILDNCDLTDDETDLLCRVINFFGDGAHPAADEASIYFFTPNYAIECLEKAKVAGHTNPNVIEQVYALTIKLEEHQKRVEAKFKETSEC